MNPRRIFLFCLFPLLVFRIWLAMALPITGDEAYFIWWGRIPDWGYYDHPPMIGWWLAVQLLLGDGIGWLRLTSVLQPFVLAAAVAVMLPRIRTEENATGNDRRWWAALFTLLAPVAVWNVLITTDTPLIYFSVFSGLAWLRARRDDDLRWYLLAGIFLAGAVLSKYFVAFLGFAYLVDALWRPHRKKIVGLALCYACTLPTLALMAWWNAGHCWPNFMFNFVNRHEDAGLSWKTPLLYASMMLYVLTPPLAWRLLRVREVAATHFSLALLAFVPLILFAILSLVKTIGLHWVLSFVPFAAMLVALTQEPATLRNTGRFVAGFALLHVIVVLVISRMPIESWRNFDFYRSTVLAFESAQIQQRLASYGDDYVLASDGYADAATLGANSRHYVVVFGAASSHARHDDILTDFRLLDHRNILVVSKNQPRLDDYAPYFDAVNVEPLTLRGATFYIVVGRNFDYPHYRDTVLADIRRKYYSIPAWLPQTACYFCQRYFQETVCRR